MTSWSEAIRQKDFAAIADWFIAYFFGVGVFALVAVGVSAGLGRDYVLGARVASLGLLLAGACTVLGWVLGLLFGIPRSLARGTSAPANTGAASGAPGTATASTSRVNTNLEDISDWLTKTFVGVGLTQVGSLARLLGDVASAIDRYGFGWYPYGHLFALSAILYFLPGGFWLGYVGTRTILTKWFDDSDSGISVADLKTATDPANLRITETGIAPASPLLQKIDQAILRVPLQELGDTREAAAWSAAQARAGNLDAAKVGLENALNSEPDNPRIQQQLATVLTAMKQYDKAAALLRDAPGAQETPPAMLSALYEDPPRGFQTAIAIGTRLLKNSNFKDDASIHVWLACAYAQQYGYVQKQDQADPALHAIKANVLAEARAAIALQASMKDLLHSFWKPASGAIDNDLSVFSPDDPDLANLLEAPGQGAGGEAARTGDTQP